MEKKRIIAVGILLAALVAVWLGVRQLSGTEQITHPALTITALPVGKADALILKTDDWAAMTPERKGMVPIFVRHWRRQALIT